MRVWIPKNEVWFYAFTNEKYSGKGEEVEVPTNLDTFGLFIRSGTIIPMCKASEG